MTEMNFASGAELRLDTSSIPSELIEMVPTVEKWGFSEQADQDLFVTTMRNHPEEVLKFNNLVDKHRDKIVGWGKSLGLQMPDSHPYWAFLDVLKIRELTDFAGPSPLESVGMRHSNEARTFMFSEASLKADNLFREKKYGEYAELLAPFADMLNPSQVKKLELAKRRM